MIGSILLARGLGAGGGGGANTVPDFLFRYRDRFHAGKVFLMYFWLNQLGSMETWEGREAPRWGVNPQPPTNWALDTSEWSVR